MFKALTCLKLLILIRMLHQNRIHSIVGFFDHNLPVDTLSRGVNRKSWRFLKKNQKSKKLATHIIV